MTLVLSRPPQQERAFENFLADQQDPTSPDYHRWLTAEQIGERFGPSSGDISVVADWLKSQGLHVTWISPGRTFIGFAGTAGDAARAFHTEIYNYEVNGKRRISVSTDPMIPEALIPVVKAIHGLYTIEDEPLHIARQMQTESPELTIANGVHIVAPADFATIYDLPSNGGGSGVTVGIVGRSRVDMTDLSYFQQQAFVSFANPTEVIPTAFGGIDPGPALTAPPAAGVSTEDQSEATLDVERAGSIASAAQLLLVVATSESGGIEVDAQYLVQTTPVPAQVMTISFGACESEAGPTAVDYWDTLFQQAAAEGISVFVSSGDSGASGCDAAFAAPPANPRPNSPNYVCSSSYATCVGGTEFNDADDPSAYWSSSNSITLESAVGYIPEGGWNEPLTSSSKPQVAASGGGVSTVIATPSWQTGTGVPAARTGRYTPDISFSASCHDGYFGCFAAGGSSCVPASNGSFYFVEFCGTSAAAPSMAGITAVLDHQLGVAQGNLNPELYRLAATVPAAFHDVTVATSGVGSCEASVPSMCNNSIPSSTGLNGGQPGFLVTPGYDEVTGLGSLNVSTFLDNYTGVKGTPSVSWGLSPSSSITTAQMLQVTVQLLGTAANDPTGTVTLSSGTYTSAPTVLANGYAFFILAAGALATGNDTLTAQYTPDASGALAYNPVTASTPVTITAVPLITPSVYVGPSSNTPSTALSFSVQIGLSGGIGNGGGANQVPTGTVALTSNSYNSGPLALGNGGAFVQVSVLALAIGNDTLTATYTPDATSATIYTSATGSASVTVSVSPITTPTVGITPNSSSVTSAQALSLRIGVGGGMGYVGATGTVVATSGTYTSPAGTLTNGVGTLVIPAGTLPVGTDTITVNYTPDAASSAIYTSASNSITMLVTTPPTPSFTVAGTAVTLLPGATSGNTSTISVSPAGGFTGSVVLTAVITSSPTGAQDPPTLSFGSTSPVSISNANAGTATLTISTTAATNSALADPTRDRTFWVKAAGVSLGCLVLFTIPTRKRRRGLTLGIMALLMLFAASINACGGGGGGRGGGGTGGTGGTGNPGTTAGSYTVTVTGASGASTSTTTLLVTVQ